MRPQEKKESAFPTDMVKLHLLEMPGPHLSLSLFFFSSPGVNLEAAFPSVIFFQALPELMSMASKIMQAY